MSRSLWLFRDVVLLVLLQVSPEPLPNLKRREGRNEYKIVEAKDDEEEAQTAKVKYTETQGHCVKSMMFTIENILRKSTRDSAT